MDLPLDFKELLEEFAREGVENLIVGGYAVAFHARPRATKDLDLLLRSNPGNLERAAVLSLTQFHRDFLTSHDTCIALVSRNAGGVIG